MPDDVLRQLRHKVWDASLTLTISTGIVLVLATMAASAARRLAGEWTLLWPVLVLLGVALIGLGAGALTAVVRGVRHLRMAAAALRRRQAIRTPVTFQLTTDGRRESWHAVLPRTGDDSTPVRVPLLGRPVLPSGRPCYADRLPWPVPHNVLGVTWACEVYGETDTPGPLVMRGPDLIAISATALRLPGVVSPRKTILRLVAAATTVFLRVCRFVLPLEQAVCRSASCGRGIGRSVASSRKTGSGHCVLRSSSVAVLRAGNARSRPNAACNTGKRRSAYALAWDWPIPKRSPCSSCTGYCVT